MVRSGSKFALGLLSFLVLVWGCGLDETYTGMGAGALPGDPLYPEEKQECPACNCTGGAPTDTVETEKPPIEYSIAGFGYRFDSLVLEAPLTDFLGDQVNNYFTEQIEAGTLNIVLLVSSHDGETGDVAFKIGVATPAGVAYEFQGDTSDLLCSLNGPDFSTTEPASLVVPADVFEPKELPLTGLKLSGTLLSEGGEIDAGVLDGVLTKEDADNIQIMGKPVSEFFDGMGIPMDHDSDGDGTDDSWRFIGSFTATKEKVEL